MTISYRITYNSATREEAKQHTIYHGSQEHLQGPHLIFTPGHSEPLRIKRAICEGLWGLSKHQTMAMHKLYSPSCVIHFYHNAVDIWTSEQGRSQNFRHTEGLKSPIRPKNKSLKCFNIYLFCISYLLSWLLNFILCNCFKEILLEKIMYISHSLSQPYRAS